MIAGKSNMCELKRANACTCKAIYCYKYVYAFEKKTTHCFDREKSQSFTAWSCHDLIEQMKILVHRKKYFRKMGKSRAKSFIYGCCPCAVDDYVSYTSYTSTSHASNEFKQKTIPHIRSFVAFIPF